MYGVGMAETVEKYYPRVLLWSQGHQLLMQSSAAHNLINLGHFSICKNMNFVSVNMTEANAGMCYVGFSCSI